MDDLARAFRAQSTALGLGVRGAKYPSQVESIYVVYEAVVVGAVVAVGNAHAFSKACGKPWFPHAGSVHSSGPVEMRRPLPDPCW